MSEQFSSPEVTEEVVIEALNTRGIEDESTLELLRSFVDKCHVEADAEAALDSGNADASNIANIKAELKIATLYSKTERYKQEAIDSLNELYDVAMQKGSTFDLAPLIEDVLKTLK